MRGTIVFPPVRSTFAADACTAVERCAQQSANAPTSYYTFQLYFLESKQQWTCVSYFNAQFQAAPYFNVPNPDAVVVYGYTIFVAEKQQPDWRSLFIR